MVKTMTHPKAETRRHDSAVRSVLNTTFGPALAVLLAGCAAAAGSDPDAFTDPVQGANGPAHDTPNDSADARPGDGAGFVQPTDAGSDGAIRVYPDAYSLAPDAYVAARESPLDAGMPTPAPGDGGVPTPAPFDGAPPTAPPIPPDDVDRCPGAPLSSEVTHTTQGLANDTSSSAACGPVTSGRDAVYRYVAPKSGRVSAVLTPHGYAALLHVRVGGCENGTELACANGGILNVPATATFEVIAGQSYYLFADQALGLTDGWFELTLAYH